MRSKLFWTLLIPLFCLLGCNKSGPLGSPVLKGAADTAGGDLHSPDYGAAWFLGARPVRYCLDWNSSFGVDQSVVSQTISEALEKWKKYIDEKGVNTGHFQDFQLAANFQSVPKCTGSEDLTFYFGVSNPQVEQAKQKLDHPISFVLRTAHDMKSGWGKGMIWFAQSGPVQGGRQLDWKKPYILRGMLLHEIGHVLGCDHVTGTIMERDIALAAVAEGGIDPKEWFSEIDRTRELVLCQDNCQRTYKGRFGELWDNPDPGEKIAAFTKVMNRDPKGAISAEVLYRGRITTGTVQPIQLTLHVADEVGANDFPISIQEGEVTFPGAMSIFVRTRDFSTGVGADRMYSNSATGGELRTGSIQTLRGQVLPVLVQRNWFGMIKVSRDAENGVASVMRIDLLDGTTRAPLFSASAIHETD